VRGKRERSERGGRLRLRLSLDERILHVYPEDGLAGIQIFAVDDGTAGSGSGSDDERIPKRHDVQDGTIDCVLNQLWGDQYDLEDRKCFQDVFRRERFDSKLARRRNVKLLHDLRRNHAAAGSSQFRDDLAASPLFLRRPFVLSIGKYVGIEKNLTGHTDRRASNDGLWSHQGPHPLIGTFPSSRFAGRRVRF